MKEQDIHFQYHTRYFTNGTLDSNTKKIWFVLHGYGQLARFFLNKFNVLSEAGVYIVAPEGLSKFYLEDIASRARTGNNRVGATWMTKENRLADIENYITYLNQIYLREVPDNFNGEISVLGFSQGAATATRWVIDGKLSFHQLILWAGVLPPDMNFDKAHEILKDKKVIEIFGKSDPYLTDERLKEATLLNNRLNIHPEIIEFEGGHEINEQVLLNLLN
jgi:predicted esterase